MAAVEAREVEHYSREKAAFTETEEEAAGYESAEIAGLALQDRDEAPGRAQGREQDAGADFLQDEVGGQLREDIRNIRNGDRCPVRQPI